jgi:hypothetical protein
MGIAPEYFDFSAPASGGSAVQLTGTTVFDFGEWKSTVASRKNDDGTISFITIDPSVSGLEFVVGERSGKRVLIIRDGQHEYVFNEAA